MVRRRALQGARSCLIAARAEISPLSRTNWQRIRAYSIQSQEEAIAKLPDINPDALSITKTTTPKALVPPEELVFGRTFT
ncbi:MAG: hypothetical protein Q9211_005891, partial [Gyalolechia sp. 1 TL-2023]